MPFIAQIKEREVATILGEQVVMEIQIRFLFVFLLFASYYIIRKRFRADTYNPREEQSGRDFQLLFSVEAL